MQKINSSGEWLRDRHDEVDHSHIDDLDIDHLDESELKTIEKLQKNKQRANAKRFGRVVYDEGGEIGSGADYAHHDRVLEPRSITRDLAKEHKKKANRKRARIADEERIAAAAGERAT